jgi:GNAT superfamily N-acetyltransferase
MFRIREVDGQDGEISDTLVELHRLTFFDGAPVPEFDHGHWWLALHETEPVAFAGIIPSTHVCNASHFCRVGVLRKHCGRRLQQRLMRALEARARLNGWNSIVSDTTPIICRRPTILFASAISYIGRKIPAHGRTRCIGARQSGESRTEARLVSTNFWNKARHFRVPRYPLIRPVA